MRLTNNRADWVSQVTEAVTKLRSCDYWAVPIEATRRDNNTSHGLVFAHVDRIRILTRRGHLTLMDSTFSTNRLKWPLYTLMVWDESGCWIAAAHLLASNEDSAILAEALRRIKTWCQGGWILRYMLTDDSAAEQAAVKEAFPGLPVS